MRKRQIRKIGNSWFIKMDPTDIKDMELEEYDEVDIEDLVILNKKKEAKRK